MEDFASSAFYSILFIYLFICLFVVRSVSSIHLFAPFDLPQHLAMFFFFKFDMASSRAEIFVHPDNCP